MAKASTTSGSWSGPTTCDQAGSPSGNYQHHPWTCQNGVPMFKTYSWIGEDGGLEVVPANQRLPGGNDGFVDGYTYIGPGSAGPNTVFTYSTATSSFTDTGTSVSPLVVYNSDGSVQTPGWLAQGSTIVWVNQDGSFGPSPQGQKQALAYVVSARDALNAALASK